MKTFMPLVVAVLVLAQAAEADFVQGRVRATMRADLELVDDGGDGGFLAHSLALNSEDGKREPVSFTLTEDTGIRCVTSPCPSTKNVDFTIIKIQHSLHHSDVIRYEAVEVLKNIPPNVRIARRKLFVTESSMEIVAPNGHGFQRITIWEVEVLSFPNKVQLYQGKPEHLVVTMTDGVAG